MRRRSSFLGRNLARVYFVHLVVNIAGLYILCCRYRMKVNETVRSNSLLFPSPIDSRPATSPQRMAAALFAGG
jgi:hypothetical protein